MDHKEVSALIRDCLSADRIAHEARDRADGSLSSFSDIAKADIAAAIAAYNAAGQGVYTYGEHETKVSIASDTRTPCVVITLGAFMRRDTGRALMPREAWELDDDHLVGELRNYLGNHVLWLQGCHLGIYPPDDYDLFTADPEL